MIHRIWGRLSRSLEPHFNCLCSNVLSRKTCHSVISKAVFCSNVTVNNTTVTSVTSCQHLKHRSLIRVEGADVFDFLQGLVTNDVHQLQNDNTRVAMYAMMLNVQGRVLYDLILYRLKTDKPSVLIECNEDVATQLVNTFQRFKLRKKIDIANVSDELHVWSVFSSQDDVPQLNLQNDRNVLLYTVDPRLQSLGLRLLLPSHVNGTLIIPDIKNSSDGYDRKRCAVGVGEGTVDFPPNACLPLECNLSFLNGVSFNKGCYIGQELTARTQYTGVIRKRIMPLILPCSSERVKTGTLIFNDKDKECGKVRTVAGNTGLALLRVTEVIGKVSLYARIGENETVPVETCIPTWWPIASDALLQQTASK